MERIHKLPLILGCLAAMAVGMASYVTGVENRTIYLRMAVMMLVFFMIGSHIKNTVLSIEKEVQDKKKEQERAEEQRLRQQAEEQKAAAIASKQQKTYTLDLVAEDAEDDFKPMEMSKAISSKVKE